jgi:hypothetical protein
VRAVADLVDPVLVEHRIEADRGDAEMARRLAALGRGQDPRVLLEIAIALGRLRWSEAPRWIAGNLTRSTGTWPCRDAGDAALAELERRPRPPRRASRVAVPRACAARDRGSERSGPGRGADRAAAKEIDPARRLEYAEALTRIQKRPGPWVYWGFRPGPRPPNTVVWEKSDAIARRWMERSPIRTAPCVRPC